MLSIRIAPIILAVLGPIMVTNHAHATDHVELEKRGHNSRQKQQSYYGGNGVPSHIRDVGTYAGSAYAMRARRNGTYVSADGAIHNTAQTTGNWTSPAIIRINARTMDEACSYEAGVCVIRP